MKKFFAIILFAALFTACVDEPATTLPEMEISSQSISSDAPGGTYKVTVRSADEWSATSDAPWVMISPANGRGEVECTVRVDSTLVNGERTTRISLSSMGRTKGHIEVKQRGFDEVIKPSTTTEIIASSAKRSDRWFETSIKTNVEFEVATEFDGDERWLTVDEYTLNLDGGARPRSTTLRCNWMMNTHNEERTALIHLRALNGEAEATISVRQNAAPLITDDRQGDSLAVVTIYEKMECWAEGTIATDRPLNEWECLRLWKADDESLPSSDAVGRVRDLEFNYFNTEEGIPYEVKYLKYLETLSLFGNVNTMLKSIDMGEEICELEYLKGLRVSAFGLVSLPKNFANLGDTLEVLDISSNNFNRIPAVLTPENFPALKSLNLASCRRQSISDLRKGTDNIGLYSDMDSSDDMTRLFLWDNLEELSLSFNYIEGQLPHFRVGEDGVRAYTEDDVRDFGDTLNYAVEHKLPRILPNMHALRLNLNFMTGELPEWLLYHPRLMEWGADILVFEQQMPATDSRGRTVKFDNVPKSMEYYFESYPLYRDRYEFNDEIAE